MLSVQVKGLVPATGDSEWSDSVANDIGVQSQPAYRFTARVAEPTHGTQQISVNEVIDVP